MVSVEEFLSEVRYSPKSITDELGGHVFVQFRERDGMSPYIEFGTTDVGDGSQDFYFEVLDMKDYREGSLISVRSPRRLFKTHVAMNDGNIKDVAKRVNDALKEINSRNFKREDAR